MFASFGILVIELVLFLLYSIYDNVVDKIPKHLFGESHWGFYLKDKSK
jgi:hypothetical protein